MPESATLLAIVLILLALAAVVAWAIRAWSRTRYTFGQAVLCLVNLLFTRILWRTRVSGPLLLPDDQGGIIVSNHISGIDPLLIQLTTERVVHWLVAREYVEHWSLAWAFRILQSIPVNRAGVDTAATKQAIRLARKGGLVGLFPEGRINTTKELLLPGRPGVALIALKARVPVVPCFVSGAPYDGTPLGSFLMPARARVVVGKPIDISDYYGREKEDGVLEELTLRFMKEIARLAGAEDYEPKLAGKRWKVHEE